MKNMWRNTVNSAGNKATIHRNTGRAILISLGFCIFLSGAVSSAQTRDGKQLVTAELISGVVHSGKPFVVGIRFTIQPEWYLYWKNPGDAGLPIEAQWDLPKGWKVGDIQYPVPSKFVHGEITAYGYKNEVVLLAMITPAAGSRGLIKARLDWLVCLESCLRGGAAVTLDLSKASSEQQENASSMFSDLRAKLPRTQKESGVFIRKPELLHDDDQWTLNATLTGGIAGKVKDFYPEIVKGLVMDLQSISVRKRKLTVGFVRQSDSILATNIRGLLVTDDLAFEVEIPVRFTSQ